MQLNDWKKLLLAISCLFDVSKAISLTSFHCAQCSIALLHFLPVQITLFIVSHSTTVRFFYLPNRNLLFASHPKSLKRDPVHPMLIVSVDEVLRQPRRPCHPNVPVAGRLPTINCHLNAPQITRTIDKDLRLRTADTLRQMRTLVTTKYVSYSLLIFERMPSGGCAQLENVVKWILQLKFIATMMLLLLLVLLLLRLLLPWICPNPFRWYRSYRALPSNSGARSLVSANPIERTQTSIINNNRNVQHGKESDEQHTNEQYRRIIIMVISALSKSQLAIPWPASNASNE